MLKQNIWMLALIILIIGLVYWAFNLQKIEHQISIFAIVGALVVSMTSVITISLNHLKAKERELEVLVIKEKQKAYQHFYNHYFILLDNSLQGKKELLDEEVKKEMLAFKKGLMNWGSEKLIKDYIHYDTQVSNNSNNSALVLEMSNSFLKSIRKELGFNDSNTLNLMSVILQNEARKNFSI